MTSRRLLGAVAATAVLFGVVALAGRALGPDRGRLVYVGPSAHQPHPEWADGHPVWVVGEGLGATVLDAVNPHLWSGIPELVGWCEPRREHAETVGSFSAWWDGSRFGVDGRWLFGPAPASLGVFEVTGRVGGMASLSAAPAAVPRSPGAAATDGEYCSLDADPSDLPDATFHEAAGSGRSVFDGHVVFNAEGAAFCESVEAADPPSCDPGTSLRLPGIEPTRPWALLTGRLLARRSGGILLDAILLPGGTMAYPDA